MSATVTASHAAAPVVITRDLDIIDALRAVPGLPLTVVAPDAAHAAPHWAGASAVIVGYDAVASCVAAELPPRDVVIITGDLPTRVDMRAVTFVADHYRADVVPLGERTAQTLARLFVHLITS